MFSYIKLFVVLFTISLVSSNYAIAGDPSDALDKKFDEIVDGLDKEGLSVFQIIRSKYGVVQAVKRVRTSVGDAVDNCVEEHSDIKDGIEKEYIKWTGKINPLIADSENKLKDVIKLQRKISIVEINEYLKLIDEEAKRREADLDAKSISDKKACLILQETMGDSRDKLVKLLESELLLTEKSVKDLKDKIEKDKKAEE